MVIKTITLADIYHHQALVGTCPFEVTLKLTDRARHRQKKSGPTPPPIQPHTQCIHRAEPKETVIHVINVTLIRYTATSERASCTAATTADPGVMRPSLQSGIFESISLSSTFLQALLEAFTDVSLIRLRFFCNPYVFLFRLVEADIPTNTSSWS